MDYFFIMQNVTWAMKVERCQMDLRHAYYDICPFTTQFAKYSMERSHDFATNHDITIISAAAWQNQENDLCAQRRQISLGICPVWSESLLSTWRNTGSLIIYIECTVKTLIRLDRCPGWSESSLGAHVILLVLSCGGSYVLLQLN